MEPKDVWCLKLLVLEGSSLPWSVRYKVAVGIVEAIGYLHNGTERCVVHRDIKPSNILLSSKKTPKANPLLQQGTIEQLFDPRLKFTQKSSKQIARMVQAAAACINKEESRRPTIDETITSKSFWRPPIFFLYISSATVAL